MSYDSKLALAVLNLGDKQFLVRIFEVEGEDYTEHAIEGTFIKAKELSQNEEGDTFCLPYFDSGVFLVLIFNKFDRLADINVNELLGFDNSSLPMNGILDPMITACFISPNQVFISFIHRIKQQHVYFVYDFIKEKVQGQPYII